MGSIALVGGRVSGVEKGGWIVRMVMGRGYSAGGGMACSRI